MVKKKKASTVKDWMEYLCCDLSINSYLRKNDSRKLIIAIYKAALARAYKHDRKFIKKGRGDLKFKTSNEVEEFLEDLIGQREVKGEKTLP